LKKLRRREQWEAGRDYRKAKRKQKTQEKRARKREARDEEAQRLQLLLQQSPQEREQEGGQDSKTISNAVRSQLAKQKPKSGRHIQLPVTILIDCGFDDLMMEKERISLGSQITRSYSDNHHAPYQAHLVISSWGGLLKERFDTVLHKHYLNWKGVRFEEGDFVEAAKKMDTIMKDSKAGGGKLVGCFAKFASPLANGNTEHEEHEPSNTESSPSDEATTDLAPNPDMTVNAESLDVHVSPSENPEPAQKDAPQPSSDRTPATIPPSTCSSAQSRGETIYLTSDSPYTISTLSPYSTYIVGGLVDKNRHKGICYKTACDRGIKTAKLPIGEFLEMSSRKVLATNHVVEILLRWLEEASAGREEGAWGRAFLSVIPKRKGGKLRGQEGGEVRSQGDDNNEQADQAEDEDNERADQDEDEEADEGKAGDEAQNDDDHDDDVNKQDLTT
jgi:tRNA (guanine9-N1)-methyltransferase